MPRSCRSVDAQSSSSLTQKTDLCEDTDIVDAALAFVTTHMRMKINHGEDIVATHRELPPPSV